MKNIVQTVAVLALLSFMVSGCKKFLDKKSDKSLSIPTTVDDFQAMLNSYGNLNVDFIASGEVSSDDYYLTDDDFNALYYESDKRLYTWQPDFVARPQSSGGDEWYNCYKPVYVCNSVLQGIQDNNLSGVKVDNVKGQALCFRAARYLDGVQVWAPAYNKQTANQDLGMVLRTDPDMNLPSVRSSVQQTYDFIVKDLTEASSLLPNPSSRGTTLPAKDAAYGLLARTYLYMGDYEKALQSAEAALSCTNAQIIDFNTLNPGDDFPIPTTNNVSPEMLLWSVLYYIDPLDQSVAKIIPALYSQYDDNDLRKTVYFRDNGDSTYSFKGTHLGTYGLTNSVTVGELYLVIAECNARLGNLPKAAEALNLLSSKRMKSSAYTPYVFSSQENAIQTILKERRKELVMRGLRWPDIKRLNRDGYNTTLTRTVSGKVYSLPPNDPRFAIAIPEDVVKTGKIQQNPR